MKKASDYEANDYVRAFRCLSIAPHHRRMLQAHYHAPDRTLTATQMAKAVGYPSFGSANLHLIPEEVDMTTPLYEGAVRRIVVNAYERSSVAREKCILYYGCRCKACGLDLAEKYGKIAQGLIHVHHLRQLAEVDAEYQVDPVQDLRPVCPTCHAVIHSRTPALTVEEVAAMIEEAQGSGVKRCSS